MNQQFVAAVNQICAEKNISFEKVMDAVKSALSTAYRKDFGNKEEEVEIILNESGTFATVLLIKEVVDEIENPNIEISLAEAKKMGFEKVLLTCDDDNIGSQKIIEANGGVLENIIEGEKEGKPKKRRYWIKIKE
jgi:hypothetical protein